MAKRVVLVDGSAMVFRAYFAVPANLATTTGLKTNAVFGFATMFRKLFAQKKPDYGAVIFDSPVKTFREERYPEYKAQRPALPDELGMQLPWISKVVEANNFRALRVPGYEADDVIGTYVRVAREAGHDVVIVSSDKDFAQVIDEHVRMHDTLRDIVYDVELVRKKWSVKPSQMVDLLALLGDTSDNIPGVRGIGEKGAAQLLEKYGSLDGIYAHLDELKAKQKEALASQKDSAYLSRELATIDLTTPLPAPLETLVIEPPDAAVLNALYRELEFNSLLSQEARGEAAKMQGELAIARDGESLREALAALARPVSLLAFYEGVSPARGELAGLAFSSGGRSVWAPRATLEGARAFLADASIPKVVHDAKQVWQLCHRAALPIAGIVFDTYLASFLAEPTKVIPHGLEQIAREYLQLALPDKKTVTDLPPYAGLLAETTDRAWRVLDERVKKLGLEDLLAEHELPVAYVLGRMELDGVKVDAPELKLIGDELKARLASMEKEIHALAGRAFNIGSPKQLGSVLFEDLKLPVLKRTKTGWSTDSEVLEKLAKKHLLPRKVVEYRAIDKLINTYTDVLQREVDPKDGRIHATFQQAASTSGRIIATEPDLQRTPVKTEDGVRIRRAFVADPGWKIIAADWSQIELRVLAHVSGDALLVDSFATGADVHRRTAGRLFGCDPNDVTAEQRNVGKTVNFATIYGQGAAALGQILEVPSAEAKRFLAEYFAAYAGVKSWLERTIAEAHENGFVTTILGRKRWIPELFSKREQDIGIGERVAANTPIQGSAADLCKVAMLQIRRAFDERRWRTKLTMQIHDELVFESPDSEAAEAAALVKKIMETCHPLRVPLVADVGTGPTWADT